MISSWIDNWHVRMREKFDWIRGWWMLIMGSYNWSCACSSSWTVLHVASIDVVRSRLIQHHAQCNATLHNSVQHRATPRNTAQHCAALCNTAQHCAQHCAQYCTTLCATLCNTFATPGNTVRNTCATLCLLLNEGYTTFTRPEMLEIEPTLKISPTYEVKLQVDADNGPRWKI